MASWFPWQPREVGRPPEQASTWSTHRRHFEAEDMNTLCSQWWPAADRASIQETATTPSRFTATAGIRSSTAVFASGERRGIGALHRSSRSREWFTTMGPPPLSRHPKYKRSRNELLDV